MKILAISSFLVWLTFAFAVPAEGGPPDNPGNGGGNGGGGGGDKAPSVSWINPDDADTVSGTVTIQIDASDKEDADDSLEVNWRVDNGDWRNTTWDSACGCYTDSWDTTTATEGDHNLTAEATDSADNSATASITVTVDNEETPSHLHVGSNDSNVDDAQGKLLYDNYDTRDRYLFYWATGGKGFCHNFSGDLDTGEIRAALSDGSLPGFQNISSPKEPAHCASVALNTSNGRYFFVWQTDTTGNGDWEVWAGEYEDDAGQLARVGSLIQLEGSGPEQVKPDVKFNANTGEYIVAFQDTDGLAVCRVLPDTDGTGPSLLAAPTMVAGTENYVQHSSIGVRPVSGSNPSILLAWRVKLKTAFEVRAKLLDADLGDAGSTADIQTVHQEDASAPDAVYIGAPGDSVDKFFVAYKHTNGQKGKNEKNRFYGRFISSTGDIGPEHSVTPDKGEQERQIDLKPLGTRILAGWIKADSSVSGRGTPYGIVLDSSGTVVEGPFAPVYDDTAVPAVGKRPGLASDGTTYVFAWRDVRSGAGEIYSDLQPETTLSTSEAGRFQPEPSRPTLDIATQGDLVIVTWEGAGILESAPEVDGPWTESDNKSPATFSLDNTEKKFFRVVK